MATEVSPLSLIPIQTVSRSARPLSTSTPSQLSPTTSSVIVFPTPTQAPNSSEQQTYIIIVSVIAGVLFFVAVALLFIFRHVTKKRRHSASTKQKNHSVDRIETIETEISQPRTPVLKGRTSRIWKEITHQREEGTLHPNASKYNPVKHSKSASSSSEKRSRQSVVSNITDDSQYGYFVIPQQIRPVEYGVNISRYSAPVIYVGQAPLIADNRPRSVILDGRRNRSLVDITKALDGRVPPPLKRNSAAFLHPVGDMELQTESGSSSTHYVESDEPGDLESLTQA
ncbi:hypothetical protein HK098_005074 [Nowakowskiella sp. JEL0407]|nr:hypothetical protein HK098_005074 [Nowakowskiella sp. JEL0407]